MFKNAKQNLTFEYRAEIDGLRAVAVSFVILFHAEFSFFKGGFVGVDIFFVISGYLIASIVFLKLKENNFSIISFYKGRARRIFPMLFIVTLTCVPIAWIFLQPQDFVNFSQSLVAVSLFVSNFFFWKQENYFNSSLETNPLLHTWSLSLEEQFYLIFPLIALTLYRYCKKLIIPFFSLVIVLSLLLAQYSAFNKPIAGFYLLPTRIWEIGLGVLAAVLVPRFRSKFEDRLISEIGSSLGLLLIFWSIVFFTKTTPHPSIYTLIPALGTLLIIFFASKRNLVGKFLRNRILVTFGLMSYSAYLWHQPLLSFAKYIRPDIYLSNLRIPLLFFNFILAYLSWKFIESPIRYQWKNSNKFLVPIFSAIITVILLVGLFGSVGKGFPSRFEKSNPQIESLMNYGYQDLYREGECFLKPQQSFIDFKAICHSKFDPNSIFLWGDSFAAALSYGLINRYSRVSQFTSSACPPLLKVEFRDRPNCKGINSFIIDEIRSMRPTKIVLAANWYSYEKIIIEKSLFETIEIIQEVSPGSQVIIIGGSPIFEPSLPILLRDRLPLVDNLRIRSSWYIDLLSADRKLESISNSKEVKFISLLDILCISELCRVTVKNSGKVAPIFFDSGHLTAEGSIFVASRIII